MTPQEHIRTIHDITHEALAILGAYEREITRLRELYTSGAIQVGAAIKVLLRRPNP